MASGLSAVSRFGMDPPPSDERLREAALYVAHSMEHDQRGCDAVKLNKVLWWADFESFRERGRSVTGAEYQKLPEGPAPVHSLAVRQELADTGAIDISEPNTGAPRPDSAIGALREPEPIFDPEDLHYLDRSLQKFRGLTSRQCSELSHRLSAGWRAVEDRQIIPYETAIISSEQLTDEQLAWGRRAAVAAGYIPD